MLTQFISFLSFDMLGYPWVHVMLEFILYQTYSTELHRMVDNFPNPYILVHILVNFYFFISLELTTFLIDDGFYFIAMKK